MKKVFLAFAAVILLSCSAAIAQDTTMHSKMHHQKMAKMHDHIMMKNGKMWMMKDGKKMEMTEPVTLKNGATVSTDGTVKMKDGKTWMMKNGNVMSMNGKMMPMKWKKPMNSKMSKDTTAMQ
ncbi:DUF6799 domain-containing protein [Pedobacter cryoconitis]|uniref:DUF6799 domain-containing protein n=1 Tax=Pedobacter cryoconitis TaxID=188932 RepID=A0A7X0J9S7_9SPHI|nr:DUF6799 domain-containing protein [Pedobacter cryoconitis]MBB6502391.1 hypothetical protein [Pedobacter cryoconitis]